MASVTLVYKGQSSAPLPVSADTDGAALYAAAEETFGLAGQSLKIIFKGKQVVAGAKLPESLLAAKPATKKLMVMATGASAVAEVRSAKSDATIRGFEAEDAAAAAHSAQTTAEELSEWGAPQHAEYRFCRFEPCTWQSFGTRAHEGATPHAFEARQLMLKLSQDLGIVSVLKSRKWRVGTLAELDPIDDRLAEKMEGGGRRLLGYNTNAGMSIHIRLRTQDLSSFLPYPSLVDTLLHELTHNEYGEHDEQFWHTFCQLKADYLRFLASLASKGTMVSGRSPLQLAEVADQAADVRAAVAGALERDRQVPASPLQLGLLDAYLEATVGSIGPAGRALGGGASDDEPRSREAMRALLAERASARQGQAEEGAAAPPPPGQPGLDDEGHGGSGEQAG